MELAPQRANAGAVAREGMMFGDKLRELRKRTGKTQQMVVSEMSARYPDVRISQTTVSAWESRDSTPRGKVLAVICDYYGVQPAYFFDDRDLRMDRARQWIEGKRK